MSALGSDRSGSSSSMIAPVRSTRSSSGSLGFGCVCGCVGVAVLALALTVALGRSGRAPQRRTSGRTARTKSSQLSCSGRSIDR